MPRRTFNSRGPHELLLFEASGDTCRPGRSAGFRNYERNRCHGLVISCVSPRQLELPMSVFSVWAPQCRRVDVEVNGDLFPMQAASGGWWESVNKRQVPGDHYRFRLNGEKGLPDPRSRYQP